MAATPCEACTAPHHTRARLCSKCAAELSTALLRLPDLAEQLDLMLARETKTRAPRSNTPREDRKLPYHLGASATIDSLRGVLTAWARLVLDEYQRTETVLDEQGRPVLQADGTPATRVFGATPPADETLTGLARWLYRYSMWLACHPAAADALTELTGLVAEAVDAVDIRPEPEFLGVCRAPQEDGRVCTAEVTAEPGQMSAACPRCGAFRDVRSLRQRSLDQAEDEHLTAKAVTRALLRGGEPIGEHDVRDWHRRGLIEATGWEQRDGRRHLYQPGEEVPAFIGRGRAHLYRLGAVRTALAEMEARHAARVAKAAAKAAA